ncbi:unnamed protein product [Umbelopsis sp. WA50703]
MSNSNKLETWGNETNMNMNPIIYQNILASPYFKSFDKKTYHEIVDEIYNEGPFMKGTAASTAFCLLFKLWTQRLTVKQVEGLIDHTDSPYIRGVGFLYLRYVCAPKELWDWLGPYIDDDEEITIVGGPKPVNSTIGKLCRLLLTDIKYYGTMLPRIPVPIARDIEKKIADYDRESKGQNGSKRRDPYADREPSVGKDDNKRRDDSRGSKGSRHDRDRRRSRSRSRSPYRREPSRHDSRDRRDGRDRYDSRDRRRERHVSPRDEFDDYERRSRKDDERRRYSRDRYSDRSRDKSRSRSRDRSSRRRSRSRDYDRRRY